MDAQQAQEGAAVEKLLHVFVIGPDTFVAHDAEDAWTLLKEHTGLERGDDDVGDDEPIQVPDDKPLKIQLDECSPEVLSGLLEQMRSSGVTAHMSPKAWRRFCRALRRQGIDARCER